MAKLKLTNENFKWIAREIHPNCEPEMVIAFSQVECKRDPFDADGFPAILYERHVVYRNVKPTSKAIELASKHKELIAKSGYGRGGYGTYGSQRQKLSKMMSLLISAGLTNEAALEGCSWGAFQELGENWHSYGFDNVGEFVDTMKDGLYGQCIIFIKSIKARGLVMPMVQRKYTTLALKYNGKGFAEFNYDGQIEDAYRFAKSLKIDWSKIKAEPPKRASKKVWLGELFDNDTQNHEKPDVINEAHNNEDIELTSKKDEVKQEHHEEGDGQTAKVEIGADGSIKAETNKEGDNEPPPKKEVVAVEKPEPKNFKERIWAKIVKATGGNLSWAFFMTKIQEIQVLGLPIWFVAVAIGIVAIGTTIWIIAEFYKDKTETTRDVQITDTLVSNNSTADNIVMLVDKDKLAYFESLGAKIVRR